MNLHKAMSGQIAKRRPTGRIDLSRELPCGAVLAAAFVLCAWLSWRTWPDILVDFGQELYVPWRIAAGDVLYDDIAWITGPLSQYANALLFQLFGVSLTTLIFANLALLAAIVAMFYWTFREIGSRWSATVIGLFFLAVFAFAQYSLIGNYNYVCPYRHDMTHGLALGLSNLLCLVRFRRTGSRRWLAACGFCLGLLSLTKIEMILAAVMMTASALVLFAWQRRFQSVQAASASMVAIPDRRHRAGRIVSLIGLVSVSAMIPMAIAVTLLSASSGLKASFQHVFLQYRLALAPQLTAGTGFYRAVSGADNAAQNLVTMTFTAVMVLAAVVGAYVVEIVMGCSKRAAVWAALLWIVIGYCSLAFVPRAEWESLPACLPVLLVTLILVVLPPALREAEPAGRKTILLLIAVYGIGLLPKILLRVRWSHYGFVLAVPGTLALIHFGLHAIPEWLSRRGLRGHCFRAVIGGLLTGCALSLMSGWVRADRLKTTPVGDGPDRFYAGSNFDGRTAPTVETLAYLREHLQPGKTLVVFPNGVMLNYLLRARNPTPYLMFSPWESDVHGGENLVADAVIQNAPDYAVIVTMDLTIHGRGNFGAPEFGGRIRKFLDEHYDIVYEGVVEGGLDGGFVSTVFKRRPKEE